MADTPEQPLREYEHWSVFLHESQEFLGRCVIWAKRKDAHDLSQATKEEREELFIILARLRQAAHECFGATWYNYSFLGNVERHLHGHFIPRYESPVVFSGMTFTDPDYGRNPYKVEVMRAVPTHVRDAIRDKLQEVL